MNGGRITVEEKTTVSNYVAIIVITVLASAALYFFFLAQKEKRETTGFDPARPVPSDAVVRSRLTPEQYAVVRQNGSETPFQNEYWNNKRPGIYVDVITGEPLFSSADKYDASLGLPTFSKPLSNELLVEKLDTSHDMQRTEVRAKRSDAHLGYLFPDPQSPTGQRYTIYSAALRFIPLDRMKDEGYGKYESILRKK